MISSLKIGYVSPGREDAHRESRVEELSYHPEAREEYHYLQIALRVFRHHGRADERRAAQAGDSADAYRENEAQAEQPVAGGAGLLRVAPAEAAADAYAACGGVAVGDAAEDIVHYQRKRARRHDIRPHMADDRDGAGRSELPGAHLRERGQRVAPELPADSPAAPE